MISTFTIHDVPIECINAAAVAYYVPAKVIISVLETEGGKVGMKSANKNGTYDYGPMQINTLWLNKVAPFGYSAQKIQNDPCTNVMVGSWILSQQIEKTQGITYWKGVGNYHSHSFKQNIHYQQKVYQHYAALNKALSYAA